MGEFFGYKAIGIYQSQAQIDALNAKAPGGIYRPGAVAVPGDRYFADINGDGLVNADDRVPIGNPQPKLLRWAEPGCFLQGIGPQFVLLCLPKETKY